MSSQNVVIVGAGPAGLISYNTLAAKAAKASNFDVILIDPRNFHVHQPSSLRMLVTDQGALEKRTLMPHNEALQNGKNKRVVHDKVVSITDKGTQGGHVTLASGETIDYSVLVLSTGSVWSGPLVWADTKEEIIAKAHDWRSKFKTSKNIVLVGGGAVGFELAGEIKDIYPNTNVTIVHTQLLPLNDTYTDSWRKLAKKGAEKRGINLVLGDAVEDFEIQNGKVTTRNGKSITTDLVVPTFGSKPNTEIFKTLGADALNESGFVRVQPTLQLVNHPRIFAAGDVIEWKEEKQLMKAMAHAPIIAQNVLAMVNGTNKLKPYKTSMEMIVLTNGKGGGSGFMGAMGGVALGDWFARMIKSKDLLIDMSKKAYAL
ncbi:hypothetical protein CPB83DRAFT_856608 [Crepidotus variabilis]|uniref:FAD/NAD(P)-binding domain-containing protein n=1 Tax=Crepidotus variabilis TaxID=179855 RepID=A0A9P6JP30_9AGAR|nr:hypothetical protein CPB83DRAFT_856608 [Crepidotus variabilis]